MPTHYKGRSEEVQALNTFIKLNRAVASLEARLVERDTLEGLTLSQFGVLEALYHLGPMCQGVLSQKLLKSTGNMTLVIDNLEKRCLVQRIRSTEDRRQVFVALTSQGEELITRIFPIHLKAIVEELNVLTPEEQEELSRLSLKLGKGGAHPAA